MATMVQAQSIPRCVGSFCVGKPKAPATAPSPAPAAPLAQPVPGAPTAGSGQYERNGRACIEELCLGDGLDALERIKWDVAMGYEGQPSGTRPVGRGETSRANGRYRGDVTGLIGYFADNKFDGAALPLMARIVASCDKQYVLGTYTTASGNPTTVMASMMPDRASPATQRWEVIRITRKIPGAVTGQQISDAAAALEQRYSRFSVTNRRRTGVEDMFQTNTSTGFQFTLSSMAPRDEAVLLKSHPACGGNGGGPVSID